jgi:hypothetical protein
MSDERIIYIGPEDDLTSLRERLEQVSSRQVTLVVPPTTQLRSQVAWQLLYKRSRELGKDVLIVSSDPQIRSVAHAGKFRVVTSLEASSTSSKSRPPSRPARTNPSRVRYPGASRALSRREAPGPTGASSRPLSDVPSGQQPIIPRETRRSRPLPNESRIEEAELLQHEPERYEPPAYDFPIDTAPPIRPVSPQQYEDEEPDLLAEDYHMSRGIREAATRSHPPSQQQEPTQPQQRPPQPSDTWSRSQQQPRRPSGRLMRPRYLSEPLAPEREDPFASPTEDNLPPPPQPEQRGGISFDQFDEPDYVVREAPEEPADDFVDGEIEFRDDDTGAFIPTPETPSLEEVPLDEEELAGPSGKYQVRPHGSQPGGAIPYLPEQEEDDLPPVERRPERTAPREMFQSPSQHIPAPPRRSTPLQQQQGTSRRSAPLQQLPPSQGTGRRSMPLQQQPARRPTVPPGPASAPGTRYPSRSSRGQAGRRPALAAEQQRSRWLPWLIVAAVVFVLLLLGYLLPTANVTLALQAREYTHMLTLVARQGGGQAGTIPAQMQTKTFAINGTLVASGTKSVGKNAATGSVTFTNNGNKPVTVPTGTVISTVSGIQFVTDAEFLVDVPGSPGNSVPVPVHAVQQGESGNVPAGTITVIPQDSLNAIAKDNNVPASSLSLQVTNSDPTSGGGVGTVDVVQQQDIDTARGGLRSQAQSDINGWLKQLSGQGLLGKPSETDQWANPPQNGQVVQNANVPVTLDVTASVLMARNSDVQKAAASQLNAFLQQDHNYQNMTIFVDAQHPVNIQPTSTSAGDASSITLQANATALAVPDISQQQVRNDITGKSSATARQRLAQLHGVQRVVNISVSPPFFPWLPFLSGHIRVNLQPGT